MSRNADQPTHGNSTLLRFAFQLGGLHLLVYLVMFSFQFKGLADSPTSLVAFGSLALSGVFVICYLGALGSKDPLWTAFFFFIIFTTNVDLYLAMALLDVTELGKFYVVTGEEYFKTSWGWASLVWDGTAHYLLQVVIVTGLLSCNARPRTRLFWCGSVLNSMPVLLIGALSGDFSANIEPATVFNAPYVIVPLLFAVKSLKEAMEDEMPQDSIPNRLGESIVAVGSGSAIVFHTIRAMAVLGSDNAFAVWWRVVEPEVITDFAKPQIMQNMFLFIYWHIFSLMESVYRIIFHKESYTFGGSTGYVAVFMAGWENFSFKANAPTPQALGFNVAFLVFSIFQSLLWNPRSQKKRPKIE